MGLVLGGGVRGENGLFNCEEKQPLRGLFANAPRSQLFPRVISAEMT